MISPTALSLPKRLAQLRPSVLEAAFIELAALGLFSGQVAVHAQGREVFSIHLGQASREYDSPVTASTAFNMASLGKMMTAVLAGTLIEQGKLNLDDTLDTCLGDAWIKPTIASRVTVAMLLTHTSGLSDTRASMARYNPAVLNTLDALQPFVRQTELVAEPGSRWGYNSTGFELLGAVCQEAAEASYWDALEDRVLRPAGMTRTRRREVTGLQADAQAYAVIPVQPISGAAPAGGDPFDFTARSRDAETLARAVASKPCTLANMTSLLAPGTASGGAYTTVEDLRAFFDAFSRGDLVTERTRLALLAPQVLSPRYRLGFALLDDLGEGYGHTGGTAGVEAVALSYRDGDSIILLTNLTRAASVGFATLSRLSEGSGCSSESA